MRKIILDTNFLFIPGYFGVDIITEVEKICGYGCEICILDRSLVELDEVIAKLKGKKKAAAKLGKLIIKNNNINILETKDTNDVDTVIVNVSQPEAHIVATQDKELKERLLKKGVSVIILRQKKYLQLQEA